MEKIISETLDPQQNYWRIYPSKEEIFLKSISGVKNGIGITLFFGSHMNNFSHFLYTINFSTSEFTDERFKDFSFFKKQWNKSKNGKITIFFDENISDPQKSSLIIKSISKTGKESKEYKINVNFYPEEFYKKRNLTSCGWLIIQNSDINIFTTCIEDWIVKKPTSKEKKYAFERWGEKIKNISLDYEKAKVIAKELINSLHKHRGIPSDIMENVSPFQQYERAISGKDKVWCSNIANIFVYACNSFNIPARIIGMDYPTPFKGKNYYIKIAEGHATTEIFSEHLNQWIWMDLTFNILGSFIIKEYLLNTFEFYLALNSKQIKKRQIVEYDPETKTEKIIPVLKSEKLNLILNYFKKDQKFNYFKKERKC
ncbi:MAG: transglutaminase domain-containing protein [Candidatus Omnitrophica bacterium]|nr:transglutaminase domain-containing protein [Candidatus Omnitrophota bacterium]